jgi:hypothetical protein
MEYCRGCSLQEFIEKTPANKALDEVVFFFFFFYPKTTPGYSFPVLQYSSLCELPP